MKQMRLSFYSFAIILAVYAYNFKSQDVLSSSFHQSIADTTSFTANQQGGWSIYLSYLNQDTPDSVQFELLVRHDNDINWSQEQFIGVITNNAFRPANSQQLSYQLLSNSIWNVRVEPNGHCFLRLAQGSPPLDDPAIFPVNVKYKNN